MSIFNRLISKVLQENVAYAHCDIPCGIYDPHNAQMAAHTIIRMTQLLEETKRDSLESEHNIARLTHFKEEHFIKFPKLKDLLARGVKLSITTRQNIDMKSAEELLKITQEIAEIFFKTKGVTPVRVKSLYPTEGEIVT